MGRLDTHLVKKGLIPTRSRAKRAIVYGLIKVNGKIIQKPAYAIKPTDQIEILNEIAMKPQGYWKLHAITNLMNQKIFTATDIVLDLGSSAGGFLEFAAQRCQQVYGIEISDEFAHILYQLKQKYPNVSIRIVDVFVFDPLQNPVLEPLDIILNDLTLDPVVSIKALAIFLPFLKKQGYILMSIKIGKYDSEICKKYVHDKFKTLNLSILHILDIDPDKEEFHLLAQKQ